MKVRMNTKLAIRLAILVVGMAATFVAASYQPVSAADGGPIFLCAPGQRNCKSTLPPLV
jgi:hypothetical protein